MFSLYGARASPNVTDEEHFNKKTTQRSSSVFEEKDFFTFTLSKKKKKTSTKTHLDPKTQVYVAFPREHGFLEQCLLIVVESPVSQSFVMYRLPFK